MSIQRRDEQDEETASSVKHITNWDFPAGHVSPSASVISKREAFNFAKLKTIVGLNKIIQENMEKDAKTIRDGFTPIRTKDRGAVSLIARVYDDFVKNYEDQKVSVEGLGRKQAERIAVSARSGATMIPKKLSRWDRLRGKKSEEYVPQQGSEQG